MGLDCYLEDELGEELAAAPDEGGALAAAWPAGDAAYPMLALVDLEGTTVFNRPQLRVVVPELERLAASVPAAAGVLRLARRAAAEPHLFLRLLGD